jgi:hypothetical protein
MRRPEAVTVETVIEAANRLNVSDFDAAGFKSPKNRRRVPLQFDRAGYVFVPNPDENRGRWAVKGKKHTVYARRDLQIRDQITTARRLVA